MAQPQPRNKQPCLTDEWDRRLAASGFVDIEDRKAAGQPLKSWHSSYFQARYTPDEFEAKQVYFERAAEMLHKEFFDAHTLACFGIIDHEREIWELHAQGEYIRDIARIVGVTKWRVEKVIEFYKGKMLGRA